MLIAVIILSIVVLTQFVVLCVCAVQIVDMNATVNQLINLNKQLEESRCRMQALVYNKFNYHVPASDKYLSLEELKLEKNVE